MGGSDKEQQSLLSRKSYADSSEKDNHTVNYGAAELTDTRSKPEETTNWTYLGIAYFLVLTNSVQYSVYFSSLWPFMKEIDPSATTSFLGYTVAIYSVGQIIINPIFGWWSTRTKSTRVQIMTAVFLNIVGNFIYCFAEVFPSPRRWALFTARLVVGISAGDIGVLRAYIAESSAPKDKITAISIGNMMRTVGSIIGPGIQAMFVMVGYPGTRLGKFHLDMYTSPSVFVICLGVVSTVVLVTCYREKFIGIRDKSEDPTSEIVVPLSDTLATFICLWLWFGAVCYYGVSESIAAPFAMVMYDWTKAEATQYVGIIYTVIAGISMTVYLIVSYLKERVEQRKAVMLGFFLMFLFYFASFPWAGKQLTFKTYANTSDINSLLLSSNYTYVEPVGCEDSFVWCHWTPQVSLPQYLVALVVGAVGFQISIAYVSVLFTMVIGPRRQGTMQGFLTMVGGIARCVAPVFVSVTFHHFGPRIPWIATGLLMIFNVGLICVFYKRLVPINIGSLDNTSDNLALRTEVEGSILSAE